MREIHDHRELMVRCGHDTLCVWAAQGLDGRSRAWSSADGRAVAVAGPALSTRDRLALSGPVDSVVPLARAVLEEVGPTYRPLGRPGVIDALVAGHPGLRPGRTFGWMDRTEPMTAPQDGRAGWLTEAELPEAGALLQAGFPDSDAVPGAPGVHRWAGVRGPGGRLLALAALAWSAPSVGLLAGVAVSPEARGRGLGRTVCRFVLAAALEEHGAAALMVDDGNLPALRLYRGLGLRYRKLRAAMATPGGHGAQ
ncbi:GNAT family N-acetyltransferase [Peterkaempfera griseoplana]|uniref:GNAT family N-acetyltransferase n=1 Tax=Peterkaempfera griseoplana TaxID=66896 RepID=UPI0007C7E07B|nr:GNAT family N-acetyltransferase [Peterkaempfera griseoplana]